MGAPVAWITFKPKPFAEYKEKTIGCFFFLSSFTKWQTELFSVPGKNMFW